MDSAGPVIGIDLGTTFSCVSVWRNGKVEIIVDEEGKRTMPSYVAFTDNEILVGGAAKNQFIRNPKNTIFDAKRLIGRRFRDPEVQRDLKLWPFEVTQGIDDIPTISVQLKTENKLLAPQKISSLILQKLRSNAEAFLDTTISNAVITVPAYFNNAQRTATIDAGREAGFRVLHVINEPTAAAVAYGLDKMVDDDGKRRNLLIFDLGGGTCDVTLLSMDKGELKVKGTSGDSHLGGVDFDNRLVDYCIGEFEKKEKTFDVVKKAKAVNRLRKACEEAKHNLSAMVETVIEIDCLHDGRDFLKKITRARFEELNMDLFNRCMELVSKCISDAGMEKGSIDKVALVGGSTRIPRIQQLLKDMFGMGKVAKDIHPDEAVAQGAAIRAAMLWGTAAQKVEGSLVLKDVTTHSLGLCTIGGQMNVVIPRNTSVPWWVEKEFTTTKDGQTSLKLAVYEGESVAVRENNLLGKFLLSDIRSAPKGEERATVRFQIDLDGILTVSARDKAGKREAKLKIIMGEH